jgi:hypothetical protein
MPDLGSLVTAPLAKGQIGILLNSGLGIIKWSNHSLSLFIIFFVCYWTTNNPSITSSSSCTFEL